MARRIHFALFCVFSSATASAVAMTLTSFIFCLVSTRVTLFSFCPFAFPVFHPQDDVHTETQKTRSENKGEDVRGKLEQREGNLIYADGDDRGRSSVSGGFDLASHTPVITDAAVSIQRI